MSLEEEIKKLTAAITDLTSTIIKAKTNHKIIKSEFVSIKDFCEKTGISRGHFYNNIKMFEIKKIGRRVFVKVK